MKRVILKIDGGMGKNVMAIGVCKAIRKQYPKAEIVVITPFTDIFQNCPYVDKKLVPANLNYFWKDYIQGKERETKMILQDPYADSSFVLRTGGHLIKIWCEMNGIEYNGELPEIQLTKQEQKMYREMCHSQDGKKVLVMQTNGGPPPASYPEPSQNPWERYSWPRDLPNSIAQKIVNEFSKKYHVLHLRRRDQLALHGVRALELKFRQICGLIMYSEKRLFIDSVCQHIAAGMGKPSTVCFVANTPQQFGYEMHTNIVANPFTVTPEYKNSVFTPFNTIGGQEEEFPYNSEDDIFDVETIISAIKKCSNEVKELTGESTAMVE